MGGVALAGLSPWHWGCSSAMLDFYKTRCCGPKPKGSQLPSKRFTHCWACSTVPFQTAQKANAWIGLVWFGSLVFCGSWIHRTLFFCLNRLHLRSRMHPRTSILRFYILFWASTVKRTKRHWKASSPRRPAAPWRGSFPAMLKTRSSTWIPLRRSPRKVSKPLLAIVLWNQRGRVLVLSQLEKDRHTSKIHKEISIPAYFLELILQGLYIEKENT